MENLVLNDHSIDTLDEIVDYLVPSTDLLRQFRDETLWKWLYEHGEDDKSNKVHELNRKNLDDVQALIQLIDALGIDADIGDIMCRTGKKLLDHYRDPNGDKVESDAKEAVSYFRKAVDAGSVEAMVELGRCYEEGWGVDDDIDESEKWYEKAAKLGHVEAQYNLAYSYLEFRESDDYEDKEDEEKYLRQAVDWLRKAATKDYAQAIRELGECYYRGRGVNESKEKAEKMFKKASELGDAEVQYDLASFYAVYADVADINKSVGYYEKCKKLDPVYDVDMMASLELSIGTQYLYYGDNSDRDNGLAVNWLRKAADKDYAPAQFQLGKCYFNGWGVGEDREEAVRWYRVAADKGHVEAQRELGKCYLYGFGVDADGEEGADLLRKAADKNDAAAKYHLGNCYRYEIGRAFNRQEAFVLYDAAAKAGNHLAQVALGQMYLEGDKRMYIRKNLPEAIKWLRQAVEGNNPDAEAARLLGKCYYSGEGVGSVNKKEALRLYHIAANGGDAKAMYNLAVCYLTGAGGEKNLAVAKFWAERAIESEDESVVEDAKKLLVKIPAP